MRCVSSMSPPPLLRGLRFPASRPHLGHATRIPSIRSFHASRPNRIIAEVLQLSHTAFQEVHNLTALPWAYSIPLTAAAFRFAWIPVQLLLSANQKRRTQIAQPLSAWRTIYREQAVELNPEGTEAAARNAEQWVQRKLREREKLLETDLKVMPSWTQWTLPIAFFPIWFANAEVVRRMTGDDRSLLAWIARKGTEPAVPANLIPAEPGLHTEGFPWVSDLISADPYLVLPGIFLGLSLLNASSILGKRLDPETEAQIASTRSGRLSLNLRKLLGFVSVAFPLVIIWQQVSSALVLYLIGSSAAMLIQRPIVKRVVGDTHVVRRLIAKMPREKGIPGGRRNR